ncbi:barttin [Phascolarctos cinereus]|uniref:Barttin n=1 Tax=Phascolarctos cinereus TaxID=38626 RepID=A0A6P5JMY8_PHACI|nr:barttin [Phascolarctos cinereus]
MAEDKTFRYGFIILGLFLLAVGMFIMTVERPQVYITFCVVGGVMLITGVVWSMCQCYPKIAFVPADTDFESFLSPKALGTSESGIPEKKSSQPPYSRLEEDEASVQSPADYRHIQMKVFGPREDQGVLSAQSLPQSDLHSGGEGRGPHSEPFMETTVVVHRSPDVGEAESHQGQPEASQMTGPQITAAPLASFKDELDSSGSSSSSSKNPCPPEGEEPWSQKADSQPDRYPDFVLIDSTGGDEDSPSPSPGPSPRPGQGVSPDFWPGPRLGPASVKEAASEGGLPDPVEESEAAPEEPKEEEEDLYYGLKDGPGGALEVEELFEPDS